MRSTDLAPLVDWLFRPTTS